MCNLAYAQSDMSIVGNVIKAYLTTLSQSEIENRYTGLDSLMTSYANMTSVLLQENGSSINSSGTWQEYATNSKPFYKEYALEFKECQIEVDYYLDMASVHVLAEQLSTKKTTDKVYNQRLWIQLELVFVDDRWHISDALWINQGKQKIDHVLMQDTLIRKID